MRLFLFFILNVLIWGCTTTQNSNSDSKTKKTDKYKVDVSYYKGNISTPERIYLSNASFEADKKGGHSQIPQFWEICFDKNNSPPDIHTNTSNFFEVRKKASAGKNFMGFVVRTNGSAEHIIQKLPHPLLEDSTYRFQVDLCRSPNFESMAKETMMLEDFTTPILLKAWGNSVPCRYGQLLYRSPVIKHTDWQTYTIEFTMERTCDYFLLEAFFDEDNHTKFYRGNLMLDNVSPISRL